MNKYPLSPKYPYIIFIRKIEYNFVDSFLSKNKDLLAFSYEIYDYQNENENKNNVINKLFCEEYNGLITISNNDETEKQEIINKFLPQVCERIKYKWFHLTKSFFENENIQVKELNSIVISGFISYSKDRIKMRPKISCFTSSYKSFDKILRPYNSLLKQTYNDWEWVIIDDSPDYENFEYIKNNISKNDYRIRLFKKDFNNGNIGNLKNEAVSLCRGEYVVELDHDDELVNDCLEEIVTGFNKYQEVGFIYMNYAECYEDKTPFMYGDNFSMGYGYYYDEIYEGNLYKVAVCPNINDLSMSNIVGVPNHPRAWRKRVLEDIGNYSECLPISDDYEILLMTMLKTKRLKINKLGYIQYKNRGNNNFSLIRNGEITKLQNWISNIYYQVFEVRDFFRKYGINEIDKKENRYINLLVDSCKNEKDYEKIINSNVNIDNEIVFY